MKLALVYTAILAALALGGPAVDLAQADQCVAECRNAHNQCRVAAKALSSPQCDAQLQACIDRCGKNR
jgi:hypothetical protein